MSRKYIPIKNKIPVGRKKKKFEELAHDSKWARKNFEKNPEKLERVKKIKRKWYFLNKETISKRKSKLAKERLLRIIDILGGKCESCGESYNPNFKKTNLEIHHLYYDENDLKEKERMGKIKTSSNVLDVLKMAENGIRPKKKFSLLCIQCHNMETFIRQNQKKALYILQWMVDKNELDLDSKPSIILRLLDKSDLRNYI